MTSQSSRIIVTGAVRGQFPTLFKKISALHAKNAFSFAVVAGDFFRNPTEASSEDEENISSLISGKIDIPIPVYFVLGICPLPDRIVERLESNLGEVCTNLYFLGKRTSIKTSEGVTIVALGGSLDPAIIGVSKDKYPPFYNEDDAKALQEVKSADLLITNEWPSGIRNGSNFNFDGPGPVDHSCIADLCSSIKPKYHISTSATFYEREPFFHPPVEAAPDAYLITRFISLADLGNAQKSKWIYAFTLDSHAAPPVTIPTGTTASPLSFNSKKRLGAESAPFSTPAQDHDSGAYAHRRTDYRPSKRARRAPPPSLSECFFCMSSPTFSAHFIAAIGTHAYLATAKGPLTTADTFPSLGFPGHMLILPIAHAPTLAALKPPPPDCGSVVLEEMVRFRRALNTTLVDTGGGKLGSVTWEVSRTRGVHTHWQYLPVSAEMVRKGLVEAAFKTEAGSQGYPAFRVGDVGDGLSGGVQDFFRLIIWVPHSELSPPDEAAGHNEAAGEGGEDGGQSEAGEDVEMTKYGYVGKGNGANGKETSGTELHLFLPLDNSFRFDIQFGRIVMAKLLTLEDRKSWQDCSQTREDEVGDVEKFKHALHPHDFTLET
ncbi:MAG: hypothetical protein M1821_002193 [Bathelium mastoideum]|nr:MAG: hypothetical protein M1821_002193 [Bathelium mastoideum]